MNQKDITILLLGVIVILVMSYMVVQQQSDKIDCDNRLIYERSTMCGVSVYDVNSGRLFGGNRTVVNLTINTTK